jgi:hypothetical protein
MNSSEQARDDDRRDPNPGAPGAYPVDTGGLAGAGVDDAIDPAREDAYWRSHYRDRPYVEHGSPYSDYGPAYAFGVDAFSRYLGLAFEEVEPEMSRRWTADAGASTLRWDSARHAVRDAWDRVNGMA